MILTSTTSLRMTSMDAMTTLRVDDSPTPSVPRLVVNPRWPATTAMRNPNTTVFNVAVRMSE